MAENKKDNLIISLLKDRTSRVLILTVVFIIAMGLCRPRERTGGINEKRYWAEKYLWRHCADVVITGDSRTMMSVSPAEMKKYLGYDRVLNFGFGANWYCPTYLDAVENVLDPESKNRTIILGISPHSMTQRVDGGRGHYMETIVNMTPMQAHFDMVFGSIMSFFDPMSFRDAWHGLFPKTASSQTSKRYMPDGFVAVSKTNSNELREVERYRGLYKQRTVSDEVVGWIIDYVGRWSEKGIKVYGFMQPTCKEMVELEKELSGFKKEEFVRSFQEAGGIWIDVNLTKYYSFDGSHLQGDDAFEFSKDFALKIKEIEENSSVYSSGKTESISGNIQ